MPREICGTTVIIAYIQTAYVVIKPQYKINNDYN